MNSLRPQRRFASPRARRALRQRGLELESIVGSGPNGRVVAADVAQFVPPQSAPQITAPAPIPVAPSLFGLRAEVDLSALAELQKRHEISTRDWIERAVARALQKHAPDLVCPVSESRSRRATEFDPALPADAQGVFGIILAPTAATSRLSLRGVAAHQQALEAVFDAVVEIVEDPLLMIL